MQSGELHPAARLRILVQAGQDGQLRSQREVDYCLREAAKKIFFKSKLKHTLFTYLTNFFFNLNTCNSKFSLLLSAKIIGKELQTSVDRVRF